MFYLNSHGKLLHAKSKKKKKKKKKKKRKKKEKKKKVESTFIRAKPKCV